MKIKFGSILIIVLVFICIFLFSSYVYAEPETETISLPKLGISIDSSDSPEDVTTSIRILLLLTVLTLAPSILMMMTSFTRIIIILSFLRNAMGTQQMPPNQVLIGLALFMTLFIMNPVLTEINEEAFKPYSNSEITQQEGLERSSAIIKTFMLKQIKDKKDLGLFVSLSGIKTPIKEEDVPKLPLTVIVPAFMISELTIAFKIGFLIYLPFLVIDMVVSSTLMSMGMMMLPPVMISLPFKILLFIMVGGWNLVTQSIINSFIL